ncbi:hypothetical protein J6Y73_02705 [bacterium]|nr:hypothetical protein [bacterium]
MKKLFIYYSFSGNGDIIKNQLENKGYDIRKAIEKNRMPKSFFFSVLIGGFRAGISQKARLVDYDSDVSSYDEIIIGSPIWNGKLTPAINTVLKKTNLDGKKITFVLYSGSGNGKKAQKKIDKLFGESNIIFLKEPKKYNEELKKLNNL